MRYMLLASIVPLVGLLTWSSTLSALEWKTIVQRDNRGTVLIRTAWSDHDIQDSGSGTGFVVTEQGHILTVAHQFPNSATATILTTGETEGIPSEYQRQSFTLKLDYIDRQADVAVLTPLKPIKLTPVTGLAEVFMPPKYVTKYETLRTTEKTWEDLDESESFVKTGDPIVQVIEEVDVGQNEPAS